MRWLETLVPPPIVAALIAFLMWLATPPAARMSTSTSMRAFLAIAIALVGGGIAAAGTRAFRKAKTTANPLRPERASSLVTSGIYRLTRNPMYVGLVLVLVGYSAWLWWLPAVAGPIGFIGYITRFQVQPEERALGAKFGLEYEAYRQRVRRWL